MVLKGIGGIVVMSMMLNEVSGIVVMSMILIFYWLSFGSGYHWGCRM